MNKKLLRRKLALMLANLKKKRPFYTEVEYLESTGTQYIDTGYKFGENTTVRLEGQFTGTVSNSGVFGAIGSGSDFYIAASPSSNAFISAVGSTIRTQVTFDTNKHYFESGLSTGFYVDDNKQKFGTNSQPYDSNVALFRRNSRTNAYGRIYYCKIVDNGNLVRDFIPVLDWNMTPCMYDRVTEQLFYNAGTGSFSVGRQIHPVDYLESTGTQYIDTGYYPNLNTKVEFMASGISADSFAASSSGTWFTGGRQAYQQKMFGSHYNQSNQNLYFSFSTTQNSSYYSSSSMYGDNKKFTLDKTGLYINDTKVVNNTNTTDFTSPATLAIFALNNNGTVLSFTGYKLQYYKIWDNNTLVRDYIPAIDENGVGYMFDRVTHTIYDNAGQGSFKYPARQVEYLEGTGTQYIDTGVRGFADFEIGVKLRESVSNVSIFCGNGYRLERYNASNPYWRFRNNNDFYNSGVPITEYHVMAWKNDEVYADGVKLQDFAKTWNVSANMTLFGASASGSYPSMIYFCKLWNPTDGTLLRDFVPAYKDGLVGLYDKVNDVLYQNIGSRNFLTGKIVEPEYE